MSIAAVIVLNYLATALAWALSNQIGHWQQIPVYRNSTAEWQECLPVTLVKVCQWKKL